MSTVINLSHFQNSNNNVDNDYSNYFDYAICRSCGKPIGLKPGFIS